MGFKWNAIAPWIAPGLLCGIALVQLAFVQFSTLSPWKGGGFGMFSTVDSPGARFLRVYLVTSEGEIPVMIPESLSNKETELRTVGTQQLANEFAGTLANGTWVKLRMESAVPYYLRLLKLQNPDKDQDKLIADLDAKGQPGVEAIDFEKFNFVRMLRPKEQPNTDDTKIDFQSIRLEMWKYSFDRGSVSLKAQKQLQTISARPE
jgi:hypothetical protein